MLRSLPRAAKHFTHQEAMAVSSHAKRSSLLRRLMAWHEDSWQTAKTGWNEGDRSGDVRSESYATCPPTHWSPAGERRKAHKSTEKNGKNKGLNQHHLRIKHSSVKIHIPTSTKGNRGRVRLQDGMLQNTRKARRNEFAPCETSCNIVSNCSARKALHSKLRGMLYKSKLFSF